MKVRAFTGVRLQRQELQGQFFEHFLDHNFGTVAG